MNILVIIGIIVAIVGIILIILINQYNPFQWTNVLVDKGEANLESSFEKKHSILMRYLDILKENKIDIAEEEYETFNKINTKLSIEKVSKDIEDFLKSY